MKTFTITLLFFIVTFAYSQPTGNDIGNYNSDYNKARRDVQKEYEAQADRNRQPNSPYVGYKGFSESEKAELQKWWDNITGKESAEAKEARLAKIKAGAEKYREQEAKRSAEQSAQLEDDRNFARPYKDRMLQIGVNEEDAEKISKQYAWQRRDNYGEYGRGERDINVDIANVGNLLAYFYQNYETADFETLQLCIDTLNEIGATITSNKLSNLLLVKFPEKDGAMVAGQIEKFKLFFGDPPITYTTSDYGTGNFKTMIEDYFIYEAKHPQINPIVTNHTHSLLLELDPYDMMEYHYTHIIDCEDACTGKEKREAKAKFEQLILQELKIKAINGVPNSTANPYKDLLAKNPSPSSLMRKRYINNNGSVFIGIGNGSQDFGITTFHNGNIYYGGHKKYGETKGKGMFIYQNGTFYEGEFEGIFTSPTKKGNGKITFPNGYYLTANFNKDLPENPTYYNASGETISKEEFESVCNLNDATIKS